MWRDAQFKQHNSKGSHLFLWDGIRDEIKHNRISQSGTVRPHDVNTNPHSNCDCLRKQWRLPIYPDLAKSSPMNEDLMLEKVHLGIHFENLFSCVITSISPVSQHIFSFNVNVSTSCCNSCANFYFFSCMVKVISFTLVSSN